VEEWNAMYGAVANNIGVAVRGFQMLPNNNGEAQEPMRRRLRIK
jgi:hypothetical protein